MKSVYFRSKPQFRIARLRPSSELGGWIYRFPPGALWGVSTHGKLCPGDMCVDPLGVFLLKEAKVSSISLLMGFRSHVLPFKKTSG